MGKNPLWNHQGPFPQQTPQLHAHCNLALASSFWKNLSHFPSNHLFVSLLLPLDALCQHKKLCNPDWGTAPSWTISSKIVLVRLVLPALTEKGCPSPGWACSFFPMKFVQKRKAGNRASPSNLAHRNEPHKSFWHTHSNDQEIFPNME